MSLIARLGDSSSHGGTIITCSAVTNAEGQLVARVGDMHICPIPGHHATPIVNGAGDVITEGKPTACNGSYAGCGAAIIAGSVNSYVKLGPSRKAGRLGGPAVLGGPAIPVSTSMILG